MKLSQKKLSMKFGRKNMKSMQPFMNSDKMYKLLQILKKEKDIKAILEFKSDLISLLIPIVSIYRSRKWRRNNVLFLFSLAKPFLKIVIDADNNE